MVIRAVPLAASRAIALRETPPAERGPTAQSAPAQRPRVDNETSAGARARFAADVRTDLASPPIVDDTSRAVPRRGLSSGGPRVAGLCAGEENGPQSDNGIAGTMILDTDPRGIAGTVMLETDPRGIAGTMIFDDPLGAADGGTNTLLFPAGSVAVTGTAGTMILPDIDAAGLGAGSAVVGPLPDGGTAAAASVDAVFASAVSDVASGVATASVSANASDPVGARNNLELARQMWRENPSDPDANARLEEALADVALAGKVPATDPHADNMTELARQMRQDAADAQRRADAGEISQEEADAAAAAAEELTVQAYELRMGIEHDDPPAQKQEQPESGNDSSPPADTGGDAIEDVVGEAGLDVTGGEVAGGEVTGGEVTGGDFAGGEVTGGDFAGGDFAGGDFAGGEFAGGDFAGGDFAGGGGGGGGGGNPHAVIAQS